MADQQDNTDDHRPSFVRFWKTGKKLALGGGRKKEGTSFVQQDQRLVNGENGESSDAPSQADTPTNTPESKAAQRRAQVRRAQIQHRQRKAGYVKDLEQEVAKIRRQIEDVDHERRALRAENEGMRAQLRSRGMLVQQPTPTQLLQVGEVPEAIEPWYMSEEMDFTMTMKLGYDEVLGAPCYMVSGLSPSPAQGQATAGVGLISPNSDHVTNNITPTPQPATTVFTPARTATFNSSPAMDRSIADAAPGNSTTENNSSEIPELPPMTPTQIQTAINFILALEHICRDHLHPSLFTPSSSSSGHTLTATSLALQSAPPSVFTAAKKTKLFPGSTVSIKPPERLAEWESSALTLGNLYRLSKVLGKDELQITPVQAWFELVEGYGLERAMEKTEELKGEVGRRRGKAVRCPHFGAVVGRGEWEGIVRGVMGVGDDVVC